MYIINGKIVSDDMSTGGEERSFRSSPAPQMTITLFVLLPNEGVVCLRDLRHGTSINTAKADLELLTGFCAYTYLLSQLDGQPADDMQLTSDVTLRMILKVEYEHVLQAILQDDPYTLNVACLMMRNRRRLTPWTSRDGGVTPPTPDAIFAALFLACSLGLVTFCQKLIQVLGTGIIGTSPSGRTLAHAAAARDQISVLQILLRKGCSLTRLDQGGHSPLAVAEEGGSRLSVAFLRQRLDKTSKQRQLASAPGQEVRIQPTLFVLPLPDGVRASSQRKHLHCSYVNASPRVSTARPPEKVTVPTGLYESQSSQSALAFARRQPEKQGLAMLHGVLRCRSFCKPSQTDRFSKLNDSKS